MGRLTIKTMSIYLARSPYRTSFGSGSSIPKLKIRFPKISGLFAKKTVAPAVARRLSGLHLATGHARLRGGQDLHGAQSQLRDSRLNSTGRSNLFAMLGKAKTATLHYEFGPRSVMIGLMMVAVLLSLVYLIHFNKVATKGYDLNRLDASRQQLLTQYDVKNMKLAQVKSMDNMIQSGRMESMRHPSNIIFVRGGTAALASLN